MEGLDTVSPGYCAGIYGMFSKLHDQGKGETLPYIHAGKVVTDLSFLVHKLCYLQNRCERPSINGNEFKWQVVAKLQEQIMVRAFADCFLMIRYTSAFLRMGYSKYVDRLRIQILKKLVSGTVSCSSARKMIKEQSGRICCCRSSIDYIIFLVHYRNEAYVIGHEFDQIDVFKLVQLPYFAG